MPYILAISADALSSPLFWAVIIGWIISVVLHEYAHGLAAHLGGDFTIRDRGGLSLNPLQYIDPVFSILIPAVILAVGGIPLPGGVTYIRTDLLRGRAWESLVSLAGPLMNIILFFACLLAMHPALGLVDYSVPPEEWRPWQIFLATMAALQLIATVLNLAPVPPLDGFHIIAPYLPPAFRDKVGTPPISTYAFFAYFIILWRTPLFQYVLVAMVYIMDFLGFERYQAAAILRAYFIPFDF